jgi:hypothetical protein
MNIIGAIILEILGALLIGVSLAVFLVVAGLTLVQHIQEKPRTIPQRQLMQIYFWSLVLIAGGVALLSFAHALQLNFLQAFLMLAIASVFTWWARNEWYKIDHGPLKETKEQFNERVRTGQADDDPDWNRQKHNIS